MNRAAHEITLSLSIEITAKGGRYVSSCPAIEVASAGRTIDEALTNIHEAVEQRLEGWVEEGTLLAMLKEQGVPFLVGHHNNLRARADVAPGVLATTINQYLHVG